MIQKKSKKAVSDVVATVLIILLTISAVSLLISFIVPFVEKNLDSNTNCLAYQGYYQFKESVDGKNYNCYQKDGAESLLGVSVLTGTGLTEDKIENLNGFVVVFSSENNARSISFTDGKLVDNSLESVWELGSTSTTLKINSPNEIKTYVYKTANMFSKAEIYPTLKSGKICEISDSIKLVPCSGELLE